MPRNACVKLLALTVALAAAPCAIAAEDGLQAASTAPLPVLLADRLLEENLGYKVTISMGQDMTGDAELTLAEGTLESDATQAVWRIAYRETGVVSRGELLFFARTISRSWSVASRYPRSPTW